MSSLDIPELRARLASGARQERPAKRGALRTLKALLSPIPPPPLLGPARAPPTGPRPRSPELELLESEAPVLPDAEAKRTSFGLRQDAVGVEDPFLLLDQGDILNLVDVLLAEKLADADTDTAAPMARPFRPPVAAPVEPQSEPEPATGLAVEPVDAPESVVAEESPTWAPSPAQIVLERLELALAEEHMQLNHRVQTLRRLHAYDSLTTISAR